MSAKHTPGPWFVQNNLALGGQLRVDSETDGAVAIVRTDGIFAGDVAMADALLIAAAPDYHEAAEALLAAFVALQVEGPPALRDAVRKLAAAHAKARGES